METFPQVFLLINTLMLIFIFCITSGPGATPVKVGLFGLTLASGVLALNSFGFIVKIV